MPKSKRSFYPTRLKPSQSRLNKKVVGQRDRAGLVWRPANLALMTMPLSERKADLMDRGSLTQRLLMVSKGDFRVERIYQAWCRPDFTERRALGMGDREMAVIRVVVLFCNGAPWVLARSVIPQSSFKGRNRFLRNLGNKPLGALLFSQSGLTRTAFEIAAVDSGYLAGYLGKAERPQSAMLSWGRRSVFRFNDLPLLVSEIFLPQCPKLHR